MYFLGQSTATPEVMLDWLNVVRPLAWERGLVPVVVASSRAVRHDLKHFAAVPGVRHTVLVSGGSPARSRTLSDRARRGSVG